MSIGHICLSMWTNEFVYSIKYIHNSQCCQKPQNYVHISDFSISEIFSKTDSEPIDKLYNGDGAHAKTKSTNASNAGEKVKPGHLLRSLKF